MQIRAPSITALALGLAFVAAPLTGCEMERRVISVRGGLAGIEGAQGQDLAESGGASPVRSDAFARIVAKQRQQAAANNPSLAPRSVRINHDDGSVTLILSSPRHVVLHLRQTLIQSEPELLYEQILSEQAKREYRQSGLDPHEAVKFLFEHRRDVLKMLQRMPQGELSPGMFLTKIGPNAYRMEIRGASAQGLMFRRLDVIWERGVCKLLSIG